ncbi:amidohydrolase family protein [Herbidospora sp. NEAU-GS84]|uniref:Amidohydrolase family protein n=1 Tax=Herbidospora solisilvae TaxID=2696284 RepID=A0A7C9N367_9ACTN|nr:amidohydrolase family protein [Herbidospora solisilvae]NAS24329.1 amidohydrolase family protein [Herbidospora solisilvae]
MTFDVVIANGWVVDGTGAPPFRADVGISAGKVTAVGRLPHDHRAVDATGRLVLPGMVDCHSHGDALVHDPGFQLANLRQGVTTVVLGQDGLSFAPTTTRAAFDYASRYFAAVNGGFPGDGPLSVAEIRASHDGAALNSVFLLPHGTIRFDVLGPAETTASPDELRTMRSIVEKGLDEGAAGLSTGLEYVPGRYADATELAALCAPLQGLPYVTHMRGYGQSAPVGMKEALDVTRRAGVPLHVSHFHGPADVLLPLLEGDTTFDTYPYLRGSTILAMIVLPQDVPAADPATALPMIEHLDLDYAWERLTIAHAPGLEWSEGLTIPEAAERRDESPARFARRLLVETELEAGCVSARPDEGPEGEESVRRVLRHPAHTGGSDGLHVGGHPHPRAYGAFARFLGHHVREKADLSWAEAASHLAAHPARRFRLFDRGLVRPGQAADLILVDPEKVADRATYADPRRLAEGVDDVWINGERVLEDGQMTTARPGRALRPA